MYVIIVGAGKVGWNLARELIAKDREVTLVESDHRRYRIVEEELEHAVQYGDATELWVLERAGIQRADLVIAVTGDDEDNILICQVAKEKYLCDRIIARLGSAPPRAFVEAAGIEFTGPDREAFPRLSPQFQSTAPGIYVEMTARMDVVCLISNCPQLNNPCNAYDPTPVEILVWN